MTDSPTARDQNPVNYNAFVHDLTADEASDILLQRLRLHLDRLRAITQQMQRFLEAFADGEMSPDSFEKGMAERVETLVQQGEITTRADFTGYLRLMRAAEGD